MKPQITQDVKRCARCGGDHAKIIFRAFRRPPPNTTHWGKCPTTLEPILMEVTEDSETKKEA